MPEVRATRRAHQSEGGPAMRRWVSALALAAVLGTAGALLLDGRSSTHGLGFAALDRLSGDSDRTFSELRLFHTAMMKVSGEYLDPKKINPRTMLHAALDELAQRVPDFRWIEAGTSIDLVFGTKQGQVDARGLDSVAGMAAVTQRVAEWLEAQMPPETDGKDGDPYSRDYAEYALINGALSTLDPHSVFMPPDDHEEWAIQARGHFGGLGITIGIRDDRLTILWPLKGTPADRAGLKPGDRIDLIGAESTIGMGIDEAVSKLRGEVGSDVTIRISDDGGAEKEVTLTRAEIRVASVRSALAPEGVGLVTVDNFGETTTADVHDAITEMQAQVRATGAQALRGVVLDLRGNPGGYLKQSVSLSDLFLSRGVIVSTVGLGDVRIDEQRARSVDDWADLPVVVLVDPSSASASEIVAGALQNNDRALVLGVRTFGKGSVQNLYESEFDGAALKLTVAQYKTPGDRTIQGVGIEPDLVLREAIVGEEDGERFVELYTQDFALREAEMVQAFQWGGKRATVEAPSWTYLCADCFDRKERKSEETAAEHLDDVPVLAARVLLSKVGSAKRSEMLQKARPVLDAEMARHGKDLRDRLAAFGVDWSAAPGGKDRTPVQVETRLDVEGGVLTPGKPTPVTLTVRNTGSEAVHRLSALLKTEEMGHREFVIGKVAAGETRSWTVPFRPALFAAPQVIGAEVVFMHDGATAIPPVKTRLSLGAVPQPQFAFAWQLLDDGTDGSRGNGDGLAQPGEQIALQVRVRNVGDGATADLWRAANGVPEPSHGPDGSPRSPRPTGRVVLKNGAGEAVLLKKGFDDFSLKPGEEAVRTLNFLVAQDVRGATSLRLRLVVGDTSFFNFQNQDLDVPVIAAAEAPASLASRWMQGAGAPVRVLSAPAPSATEIASAPGVFEVDGKLGAYVRTRTPWGTPGWVLASDVKSASRPATAIPLVPSLSFAPPTITLVDGVAGTVTEAATVRIQGSVRDDEALRDIMVFVRSPKTSRGRKVAYQAVGEGQKEISFNFEVPVPDGESSIIIVARDGDELRTDRTLGVFRAAEWADAGPARTEAQ